MSEKIVVLFAFMRRTLPATEEWCKERIVLAKDILVIVSKLSFILLRRNHY